MISFQVELDVSNFVADSEALPLVKFKEIHSDDVLPVGHGTYTQTPPRQAHLS